MLPDVANSLLANIAEFSRLSDLRLDLGDVDPYDIRASLGAVLAESTIFDWTVPPSLQVAPDNGEAPVIISLPKLKRMSIHGYRGIAALRDLEAPALEELHLYILNGDALDHAGALESIQLWLGGSSPRLPELRLMTLPVIHGWWDLPSMMEVVGRLMALEELELQFTLYNSEQSITRVVNSFIGLVVPNSPILASRHLRKLRWLNLAPTDAAATTRFTPWVATGLIGALRSLSTVQNAVMAQYSNHQPVQIGISPSFLGASPELAEFERDHPMVFRRSIPKTDENWDSHM